MAREPGDLPPTTKPTSPRGRRGGSCDEDPVPRPLAAACAFALLAPAGVRRPTVTVRVEGDGVSARPTTVDAPDHAATIPGADNCAYDSRRPARSSVATGGNWDREPASPSTILGETHDVHADATTGSTGVNRSASSVGICDASQPLQDGDEILSSSSCDDERVPTATRPSRRCTSRAAPGARRARRAVAASTVTSTSRTAATRRRPPARRPRGVDLAGGGASATTGADGPRDAHASSPPRRARASGPTGNSARRSSAAHGRASTDGPARRRRPATRAAGRRDRADAVRADRIAPRASVEGQRVHAARKRAARAARRGRATRAACCTVKLRLTRNDRGRCSAYSGKRERFVRRTRCGAEHGWWFAIGDQADWEYQLPARLPRGRYVLDVNAIDKAYNRDDERRRGENRVVFTCPLAALARRRPRCSRRPSRPARRAAAAPRVQALVVGKSGWTRRAARVPGRARRA